MHLPVLLLALATTLPSPGEAVSACDRHIAGDLYDVLDCEQAITLVAMPAETPATLDAEDDDESTDPRRRAQPASDQRQSEVAVAIAPVRFTLPSTDRADTLAVPSAPRERFLKLAIPRARAQLPDPAPIA